MRPVAFVLSLLFLTVFIGTAHAANKHMQKFPEPALQQDDWANLEEWQRRGLQKADAAFNNDKAKKNRWKQAKTAYALFLEEFPQSENRILAYALYRQARAMHHDNHRADARRVYQDVLDFFPNEVPFAAASAYFRGLTFEQDGDRAKAVSAWATIAKDKEYIKEPLAAYALTVMAEYMVTKERYDEAGDYLLKVVTQFRKASPDAANKAIAQLKRLHLMLKPNEARLREVYLNAKGFGRGPIRDMDFKLKNVEQVGQDNDYWHNITSTAHSFARRDLANKKEARAEVVKYWTEAMKGKFAKDDEFQIRYLDFKKMHDGDEPAWVTGLRKQYDDYKKPGDAKRVMRFMSLLEGNTKELETYYTEFSFDAMTAKEAVGVTKFLYGLGENVMGDLALKKVAIGELNDEGKADFALFLNITPKRTSQAKGVVQTISDEELKNYTLFCILMEDPEAELDSILAVANKLKSSQKYAAEVNWERGDLLRDAERYNEAASAFLASGRAPDANFEVADCYMRQGSLTKAINELKGIEAAFKSHAARAAFTQARYYDKAKDARKRDAAIIHVLKVYRGTREHSKAHQWREDLGGSFIDDDRSN